MKRFAILLSLAALGGVVSIGAPALLAQSSPLSGFCPDTEGAPSCASAVQIYLDQNNPTDNQTVALVNFIADSTRGTRLRAAACADAAAGIELLTLTVENDGLREQIAAIASALCGGRQTTSATSGGGSGTAASGLTGDSSGASGGPTGTTSGATSSGATSSGATSSGATSSGATSSGATSSGATSSGASGG